MSEQKIPAPVLDNLAKAAELDILAADAERQSEDLNGTIAELERQLAALKATHTALGRAKTEATEDAAHYRHMAYGRATTLSLPEAQIRAADKAAQEAAAAPPVPALPQLPAAPQITAEDPLGLAQLDHTAAHSLPAEVTR